MALLVGIKAKALGVGVLATILVVAAPTIEFAKFGAIKGALAEVGKLPLTIYSDTRVVAFLPGYSALQESIALAFEASEHANVLCTATLLLNSLGKG